VSEGIAKHKTMYVEILNLFMIEIKQTLKYNVIITKTYIFNTQTKTQIITHFM
jgi:hypothetical protein